MKQLTRTYFALLLLLILLTTCQKNKQEISHYHMPAEWEPHEAVWLGWEERFLRHRLVTLDLIRVLKPHVALKIVVYSDSLLKVAKSFLIENKIDTSGIRFYIHKADRFWIRDHGATFLLNQKGELGVADFDWNWYGDPEYCKRFYQYNPDSVDQYMQKYKQDLDIQYADSLMATDERATIRKAHIFHEGGAMEVNGKGTLILCEATVFERNPGMSRAAIENEFKQALGVKKIIWMKQGLADDPSGFFQRIYGEYVGGGTGGHTDEFVRFANPSTILLAWVNDNEKNKNPINKINAQRMFENFEILKNATDQDGKPFRIIKVPLPELNVKKVIALKHKAVSDTSYNILCSAFPVKERPQPGDTLIRVASSSYLNYLITNEIVVLPTYQQVGTPAAREDSIKQIFKVLFPDRKLVFIDAMPVNWGGGGIHCSTQQQPRSKSRDRKK